jgi:hypothetical protein
LAIDIGARRGRSTVDEARGRKPLTQRRTQGIGTRERSAD